MNFIAYLQSLYFMKLSVLYYIYLHICIYVYLYMLQQSKINKVPFYNINIDLSILAYFTQTLLKLRKHKIIKMYNQHQLTQDQSNEHKNNGVYQLATTNQSNIHQYQSQHSASSKRKQGRAERKKYGNMLVIFQNDRWLITLGPDYICFTMAIIGFILLDYFTVTQIYAKPERQLWGTLTAIGSIVQIFSYIMVAISNPGIITKADFDTQGQQQASKIKRFCNICNMPMLPRSRHCSQCNVCIKGYDHHCPWVSKCIGQHNLYRFYFFAGYTPIFIIYCVLVLSLIS